MIRLTQFVALLLMLCSTVIAQDYRVRVVIENLAPSQGTSQTPVWVGFHNGTFDLYSTGVAAGDLPFPGSIGIERLAEDGNTGPISADFSSFGAGLNQGTLPGPNGPIAPGDRIAQTFVLNSLSPLDRYFSYGSMVLPSNDAFIANGNPLAHPIFDANGMYIAEDFIDGGGSNVLDAGTEVNDEIPMNTAFFGQMMPNTGVVENGLVGPHPGFLPRGSGAILDDPRFRDGDFNVQNYPNLRFGFRAAPAIQDDRSYLAILQGTNEVPSVNSPAVGGISMSLNQNGEQIEFLLATLGLCNFTMAHLHLGPVGQNGPVVATLVPTQAPGGGCQLLAVYRETITAESLSGPLADFPLDELVRQFEAGNIYVNVHTSDGQPGSAAGPGNFPSGELRGQVERF